MAILHPDKIILHRTVIGVRCPMCGGVLDATANANWLWKLTGKKRKIIHYRCLDCRKQYKMSEVS